MSEKKKHHSFRVKLPAREVMRRLREYYSHDDFEIHMIDATGYDLIYAEQHISLREDAESNETIIFIGFLYTVNIANDFKILFLVWMLPTLLFTFILSMNTAFWYLLSVTFLIISLIVMKDAREERKTEYQYLTWFIKNMETIPEMVENGHLNSDDKSLSELENPLEMKRFHE